MCHSKGGERARLISRGFTAVNLNLCLWLLLAMSGKVLALELASVYSSDIQIDDAEPEEKVEIFTHKLATCRRDSQTIRPGSAEAGRYSDLSNCLGRPTPKLFSKFEKYPVSLRNKNKCKKQGRFLYKPVYIPVFCKRETLQLRLDMPENPGNETAFLVTWNLGAPAAFFCPHSFNRPDHNGSSPKKSTEDSCISQVCRQKSPLRSYPSGPQTVGTFHQVGNTWIVNLNLWETPGRYRLVIYIAHCPSDRCKLEDIGIVCCAKSNQFDFIIVDSERIDFDRPAVFVGDGQYNVTIYNNDAFSTVNVTDVSSNKTVEAFLTPGGMEDLVVTLEQGIYQVTGEGGAICIGQPLASDIVLEPRSAEYQLPVEFVDLFTRKLKWSVVSDLPRDRFEFYPQDNETSVVVISRKKTEHQFSISGGERSVPAILNQTFAHRVFYEGVEDSDNPTKIIPVDLSAFLPSNVSVSHNDSHASVLWHAPDAHKDLLAHYRVWVTDSLLGKEAFTKNITADESGEQRYVYSHRPRFLRGEVIGVRIDAVYRDNITKYFWYGPSHDITVTIHDVPDGPDGPTPDGEGFDTLEVILGGALGGVTLVTISVAVVVAAVLVAKCRVAKSNYALEPPIADNES